MKFGKIALLVTGRMYIFGGPFVQHSFFHVFITRLFFQRRPLVSCKVGGGGDILINICWLIFLLSKKNGCNQSDFFVLLFCPSFRLRNSGANAIVWDNESLCKLMGGGTGFFGLSCDSWYTTSVWSLFKQKTKYAQYFIKFETSTIWESVFCG